ncbi:MAG: carboxypeptidase-like regulatory domain-containing protein [Vicinamibacterales bacterium]
MTRGRATGVAFLVAAALGVGSWPLLARAEQQPAGASVAGIVSAAADGSIPVARAWVMVRSVEAGGIGSTTLTDESGRFVLDRLPAGRYIVAAAKAGHVPVEHGALAGRRGVPIALAAGERRTGVTLHLPKGAVISGVVRDGHGRPVTDCSVALYQRRYVEGRRALTPLQTLVARNLIACDDLGRYRVFGLAAGEYAVAADPGLYLREVGIHQIDEADIQRALRLLAGGRGQAGTNSRDQVAAAAGASDDAKFARVFHPGTPTANEADIVTVRAGEERDDIDIVLAPVGLGRIDGAITGVPPGLDSDRLRVSIQDLDVSGSLGVSVGPDGRFSRSVAAGRYRVSVRTRASGAESAGVPTSASPLEYGAAAELDVRAGTATVVSLPLQPARRLDIHVSLDDGTGVPPLRRVVLAVLAPGRPADSGGSFSVTPGEHEILSLLPDVYAVTVHAIGLDGQPGTTWAAQSITANGRRVGSTLDLRQSPAAIDVEIRMTSRPAQVRGRVEGGTGPLQAPPFIIMFPSDRSAWVWRSDRIRVARPDEAGTYVIDGLPAGDYLLAAVTDVEDDAWFDPDVLATLVPAAIPVTLANGDDRTQDLRVGGGR